MSMPRVGSPAGVAMSVRWQIESEPVLSCASVQPRGSRGQKGGALPCVVILVIIGGQGHGARSTLPVTTAVRAQCLCGFKAMAWRSLGGWLRQRMPCVCVEAQSRGTACKGVITMAGSHERPHLVLLETQ